MVSSKFDGESQAAPDLGYLLPQLESGSLERDSRQGHGLKIADQSFERGIHCPSRGTVQVHLPAQGESFNAAIGVDSNDITYYSSLGRGNVTVVMEINGEEAYRSPVMHEGTAAISVNVDLNGARDFTLHIEGTRTAINWDQVDFANARVALRNGKQLQLDVLPTAPLRTTYTSDPPFSFVYGGVKSPELLKHWLLERRSRELDPQRTEHTQIYRDTKTGLEVRCIAVEYHDFPTVEWTIFFKNSSSVDSPILENIQALDLRVERNGEGEFQLHHNKGAPATPTDYEPYDTPLPKHAKQSLSAKGGRSSDGDFPYFNLAWPDEGVIIVVGWPGQWAGQFAREDGNSVQVRIGQELTRFKLLPGEEVRAPRIVMQFWQGDWRRSQNIWRRWMETYNTPHPGGKLPQPSMAGNTSREYVEMMEATDSVENMFIDRYVAEKLTPDYFWMDAGWYINDGRWENVGTWEVDPKRFPNGLKVVSDHAHENGIKTILWFEPERVTRRSWLYEHHPEWLLATLSTPKGELYDPEQRLFNSEIRTP